MENKIYNTHATYKVRKASREQIDCLIDTRYTSLQGKRDVIVGFIAVDNHENIIGHLIAEEKTVPPPLNGTDWFIWNIFTPPELRRQGIATVL
jgi:ribosomal protein S18 acetylase RimI-like enzyme